MKVLMLNPAFSGGLYTHELCRSLAMEGCEVDLFTGPVFWNAVDRAQVDYDVRIAFSRFTQRLSYNPGPLRPVWRAARLLGHLWSLIRTGAVAPRYDLIHTQFLPLPWLDGIWLRRLARRTPVVYTVHNLYPHDVARTPTVQRSMARIYGSAAALIAHAQSTTSGLVSEFGVDRNRIWEIPHGAIVPPGGPVDAARDETAAPVVLMFGQVRPGKGLDVLLRATAALARDGLSFSVVVAGELADRDSDYRGMIRTLGIADRVTVRFERIPTDEVGGYFRDAAIVVLPYRAIDQSGVAVMAATFGRTIVASDVGGIGELVRAAECGLLVPPDDPAALADALRRAIGDPGMRHRFERNGAEYAARELAWPTIAARTVRVYEDALSGFSPEAAGALHS